MIMNDHYKGNQEIFRTENSLVLALGLKYKTTKMKKKKKRRVKMTVVSLLLMSRQ